MNLEEAKNYSHVLDPKDETHTACGVLVDVTLEIKDKEPSCLECVQALTKGESLTDEKPQSDQEEPVVHWACIGSLSACGCNESGLSSSDISDVTCPECQTLYTAFGGNKDAKKSDESMTVLVIHIGVSVLSKVVGDVIEGLVKSGVLSKLSI